MTQHSRRNRATPTARLTHLDSHGHAHMVDVSAKHTTVRKAVAEAVVTMSHPTWRAIVTGRVPKGDVAATARIAGIMAAKKTSELIPLCHPLAIDAVTVAVDLAKMGRVRIVATATIAARTGVEMEALTAVSVAALAVYDMTKALERGVTIGPIRLLEKSGGQSGPWKRARRPAPSARPVRRAR